MSRIFADACYWIALLDPKDELHEPANEAKTRIGTSGLITTDEVLSELLTFFGDRGVKLRMIASDAVEGIRSAAAVVVVPQSRESFDSALALYRSRPDKQYSLVDCRSFELMKREGITEALTGDHHFEQEGFKALLRA